MNKILFGDCRQIMQMLIDQGKKVQMCVTSPPYFGLRDYGMDGQLGLEPTVDEYVQNMVEVFRLVREQKYFDIARTRIEQAAACHQPEFSEVV